MKTVTKTKKISLKERAEKIFEISGFSVDYIGRDRIIHQIMAEIREAVDFEVVSVTQQRNYYMGKAYQSAVCKNTKKEAYEEAAQVVQKWIDGNCVGPNPAVIIRTLKSEV